MLHTQIANAVASSISLGHFRTGDRLPPERELAKEFGVNRLTVRQALADLQLRKLILRRTGRNGGTFIAEPVIEYDLTTFAGFSEQARRLGHIAGARVLRTERVEADEATAEALQLSEGEEVFEIDRLRFANDLPVLLEHSVSRLSDSPACSVSRSTDRLRTPRAPLRRPAGARGRANLTGRRECAHRAPTGRHPGHAATARRT